MFRTRTLVAAAAVALLSVGMVGCSSASDSPNAGGDADYDFGDCEVTGVPGSITIDPVVPGTLTAATVLPAPGWWTGPSPDAISSGFEYCIAANVAYRAGLKSVTVQNQSWDQLISGSSTNYDVGMTGITITEPRKEIFDFSDPYFESNLGVAIRKGDDVTEENIRTKRIGGIQGNTGSQFAMDVLNSDGGTSMFPGDPEVFTALKANQIDVIIHDTTSELSDTGIASGDFEVIGQFYLDQNYGMIMPKGGPNVNAVNLALTDMKGDGTLAAIIAKQLTPLYSGVDPSTIPIWTVK